MWRVKNINLQPVESPITKIRFIPNRVLVFEMDTLPGDIQRLVDKGRLEATRVGSGLNAQIEIEKELHKVADEIFLDWGIE